MKRVLVISVVVAALLLGGCSDPDTETDPQPKPPDTSRPTEPDSPEGKIAFARYDSIHTMNLDGSDEQRLTEGRRPLWSPDGEKILFHNPGEGWVIINADGTDRVIIPPPEQPETIGWYHFYDWSPTGEKVMFVVKTSGDRGGIYLADADGSDFTQILSHEYGVTVAAFSPNGDRIAYLAAKGSSADRLNNTYNLYLVNSDGTNNNKLAEDDLTITYARFDILAWSPDGENILYGSDRSLYVIDADGTNRLRVGHSPDSDGVPQWSPDGSLIAYSSRETIRIVKPDGTGFTELCSGYYVVRWSPDGKRVWFSRQDGLYSVDIDGTNITKLLPLSVYGDIHWVSP